MVRLNILVLMLVCILGNTVMAATNRQDKCEQAFKKLASGHVSTQLSEKIKYWKSLSGQCAGTGLYEYRLSNLYIRAEKYRAARHELESALKRGLPHKRELLAGMVDLASAVNNLSEARTYAEKLIREFPDYYVGYQEMGTIDIQEEKFKDAIPFFLKANKLKENWFTYRCLAISYFYTNQNKASITAFDKAYNLNNAIVADRMAMLVGANAYMNVGNFKVAHGVLLMLAKKDPAVKSDPTFVRMYRDVESALKGH